jgi:predicted lipoprotein with Yx(FWY)xxD motif
MKQTMSRHPRYLIAIGALAVAASISVGVALASGGSSTATDSATRTMRVVKEAQSDELGHAVLTNRKGLTLYSLSVEKNGRFICTDQTCLSLWHPLVIPAGTKPIGPVKLGTVRRPDGGRIQVTYQGRPLYRFVEDRRPGDVNGEGFKDVGTWHAANGPSTAPAEGPAPTPAPAAPQPSPGPTPPQPPPAPYPYPEGGY